MAAVSDAPVRRSPKSPRGLLGMLVLVALVETAVALHPDRLESQDAREWAIAGAAAGSDAVVGREVLVLGGSMASHGVVPSVVRRASGLSVYSLAIGFGPPAAQYALLRRSLDSGATPRALLIDLHPAALAEPPRWAQKFWPHLLTVPEIVRLSWVARDPFLLASSGVRSLLPVLRDRETIRAAVLNAVLNRPDDNREFNRMIARNKRLNDGGMIKPLQDFRGAVADHFRPGLLSPRWSPAPANLVYVREIFDVAAAREIAVFWLIPPFCPTLRAGRSSLGLDAAYLEFAASLQAEYPNLTVIDAQGANYTDDLFSDPVHLNRRGASALSTAVGEVLRDRLDANTPGPRLVALPAYRAAPDEALEDLVESFMAVRQGRGVVR